jgi:hypothetical protein
VSYIFDIQNNLIMANINGAKKPPPFVPWHSLAAKDRGFSAPSYQRKIRSSRFLFSLRKDFDPIKRTI